jgi:hypothetical protein
MVNPLLTPTRERRRVARHLLRAEKTARTRDVSNLDHVRQLIRSLLLDALADYRREGRFPKNTDFPWAMPSFIDRNGTRCAMAHLLELGGAGDLVKYVHENMNFAFVRELAHMPEVTAWLDAAGLTVEEAALIQPTYCDIAYSDCVCDVGPIAATPATGVLEGKLSNGTVRVDAVYGNGGGFAVGDVVKVFAQNSKEGDTILVPITSDVKKPDAGADAGAMGSLNALALDGAGRPTTCSYNDTVRKLPVSKDQVVAALQSKSCKDTMANIDKQWMERPPCSGGCFCDTSGTPHANASVGILLAVVGALVAMRARRR